MPCSKYKSKEQRGLCYLTNEWENWGKVMEKNIKVRKESIEDRPPFKMKGGKNNKLLKINGK